MYAREKKKIRWEAHVEGTYEGKQSLRSWKKISEGHYGIWAYEVAQHVAQSVMVKDNKDVNMKKEKPKSLTFISVSDHHQIIYCTYL